MKNSLKYIILILTALFSYNISVGQTGWEVEKQKALKEITEELLLREISFLSDTLCNGRATGTQGNVESAFWIARKFKNAGLSAIEGSYGSRFITPNGTIAHNVIGMLPGSYTVPRESYIIVGAHFDHLGCLNDKLYPGADSNASGVVALTSLADIFGSMRKMGKVYDTNIIFAAFDAKEMNMAGSEALWKLIEYGLLKDPISGQVIDQTKIKLMVNIDQIGSSLSPIKKSRPDYLIMLGNESLKAADHQLIDYCNNLSNINLDLCKSYYGSKTFTEVFYRLSDQRIFVDKGIPAVLFTSGITMNTNKTRDTAENLDIPVLSKRITLIFHWLNILL